MELKNEVARKSWPDFAKKDFFQPLVYYTHQGTFVVNPNEHIRSMAAHEEIASFKKVPTLKLAADFTDTTDFQFSSSYSDSDSTALYYQENVLSFQSFDLTRKFIPDITDIQDWSIMVIHELFHGYQRSIPEHKAYYLNLEIPGGPDEFLGAHHRNLNWYKESVQEENELLKSIWIDGADVATNLSTYDSLRSVRIDRIKQDFGLDIREAEDYEIMMEGQARYVESLCKRYLSSYSTDTSLLDKQDQALITNMYQSYDVTKDKGLYNLYNDRYYYQLGFNISMILEKHLPDYKESIYVEVQNFDPFLQQLIAPDKN